MARSQANSGDIIGLIPAAGLASRLGPLPCSKEIYPLGAPDIEGTLRPKAAAQFLLERFRLANICRAFVIIRPGKWDIPAFLGDGKVFDVHLAYLMMGHPFGSPFTLGQAWPFIQNNRVALGFPDVLFQPEDAYVKLLDRQEDSGADVVLGLFPADQPTKMDMVETNAQGRVTQIIIKPNHTVLHYSWLIAVWTPKFSGFLHEYLEGVIRRGREPGREFHVGNVFQAWMDEGLPIEAETFRDGHALDIGTPADLQKGIKFFPDYK